MSFLQQIDQPTLLVDEEITLQNIQRMFDCALSKGVDFRPHFKTHQSAVVGGWFKKLGVSKITVSSVEMAEYFADHEWNDILIAFSLNPRQVKRINALAEKITLGVVIENHEALFALAEDGQAPINVWIKIDVGNGRTGVNWQSVDEVEALCLRVQQDRRLRLAGLLTHSGHTYHALNYEDVARIFREGVQRLINLRTYLSMKEIDRLMISVGDTPGCSVCGNWSGIDEIRPGNFVFYDVQQALAGVCRFKDVSVALACPIVAKHPERCEVVVYGGAIHLSKDYAMSDGKPIYGLPAFASGNRWGEPIARGWVDRLSQEHGILVLPREELDKVSIGDLLFILPAHSCLTVQVMRQYFTLKGDLIPTLNQK